MFVLFFLSFLTLVVSSVGFSGDSTGVEDITVQSLLLSLSVHIHIFVHSVAFYPFMSDCTVNHVKAYPAYSRYVEVD